MHKAEKLNDKVFKSLRQSLVVSKYSCFSPSIYQCLCRCLVLQFVTFIVVMQHMFILPQIRASQIYLWWYEDFCQVQTNHWSKPPKSFGEPISYFHQFVISIESIAWTLPWPWYYWNIYRNLKKNTINLCCVICPISVSWKHKKFAHMVVVFPLLWLLLIRSSCRLGVQWTHWLLQWVAS